MSESNTLRRRLLILPPILIGVLVLVWLVKGREPPAKATHAEQAKPVRTLTVEPQVLVPVARGFGPASPGRVWSAVAQVSGRVVYMLPELRNGESLPEGTVLLKIDRAEYELAAAKARAALGELDVQAANARKSMALEQRNAALAEKELKRKAGLAKRGTLSRSDSDAAERTLLTAQTAVQNLRNTLALVPVQRKTLQAQLDQAELDLARTEIKAPFNMRVAGLAVEQDQFVSKGQVLFQGDALARTEVLAQFDMSSIRKLFDKPGKLEMTLGSDLSRRIGEFAGFRPRVRLDMGGHVAEWEAEFVRFSDSVDSATRTLGVVVAVDKPWRKVIPGQRPPLSKGMFVEVVLRGKPQPDRIAIPRSAVRDGKVYLVDQDARLRQREVTVRYYQDWVAVISDGLKAGDQVVLSDLVPAVPGMLLKALPDAEVRRALAKLAGGKP